MDQLLQKYKPIFYLHSKEKYFPVSVDFLLNLPIYKINQEGNNDLITEKSTQESISKLTPYPQLDRQMYINIPQDKFEGEKKTLQEVPVYAFFKETEKTIDLYYVVYYAFNLGKNVLWLEQVGDHQGDVEAIIVEVNKETLDVNRVFFGAHGTEKGRWVSKKDVEFQGHHPIAYVAYGGHGNYPRSGVVYRFYGFGNDLTNRGILWDPKISIVKFPENKDYDPVVNGWNAFTGLIGFDGVTPIIDKGWYENKPLEENLKSPPIYNDTLYHSLLYFFILALIYFIISTGLKSKHKILYFSFIFIALASLASLIKEKI